MKTYRKFFVSGLAIIMMMVASNCSNLTDGLSTDPVNITDGSVIATSKYLSGVEVSLTGVFEGDMARLTGMWNGYFSGEDRQYLGLAAYSASGQDFDVTWGGIYTNVFANTRLLKKGANATKNYVSVGIAQTIEGMCMGLAADLWGDVPVKEITQGPIKITTPKFDTQADAYARAHQLLDSAIVNLGLTGNGTGDYMLNGNKTAWIQVAHTVKARLYLHVRDYSNALIQSGLGVSSVSNNLMATHGQTYLQNFNFYYSFTTYDRSGYMGANSYAPRLLDPAVSTSRNNAKTNEEARLNYLYYPGGGLNFQSIAYEPNVLVDFDWGTPTAYNGFFGATTSFPIVTWQENLLITAEANMKIAAPNTTNALNALNTLRAYYNTGAHVSSGYVADYGNSYQPYLITDFAAAGIENPTGAVSQNTALLREILEERYVTLLGQIEGWNDMRRTGNFLNIPLAAGKTNYPRRLLYSQIEINTNPNVPKSGVGLYDPVTSFSSAY